MVILDLVLILGGAGLLAASRTRELVLAYLVLAAVATLASAPSALHTPLALAIFALSATLKLIAAPAGLLIFAHRYAPARDLRPSLPLWTRALLAALFVPAAAAVAAFPALAGLPLTGFVAYLILCSIGTLIVHRNLLAHLIGLLSLGAAVTLAGTIAAPSLPEPIELGASFDALVATFVGLALVRAFVTHNPMLDVDALRELRG